jgi:hypothetical protein
MGFMTEDQVLDEDYYCEECKPELHTDLLKCASALFYPSPCLTIGTGDYPTRKGGMPVTTTQLLRVSRVPGRPRNSNNPPSAETR